MLLSRRNQESRTSLILAVVSLLIALVASSATGCSAEGDETPPPMGGVGGFLPGTGGYGPGTGGNVAPPPTGGTTMVNTGGTSVGTGGISVGTGGMGGAGGGPDGSGGDTIVGGTGGMDTGTGGMDTGTGGAGPPPKGDPIIPPDPGDCPEWRSGTITYKNLGGITVSAGAKAGGPSAPMLIYWHGTASTSGEFNGMAGAVANGVKGEGGIIISFQGTTGGDGLSGTSIFGKGDLNLIDGLVSCAVKTYNVDPRRIFTMGCSAGGLMSAATATLRSNYIAAAAPNSGGYTGIPIAWQSAATPALMTVHGAKGTDVVFVDFSTTSANADRAFKAHGSFVINCDHGGRHCAGSGQADDVWKFFKAHPYGTSPSPWAGGLPAGFDPVCKIYQ